MMGSDNVLPARRFRQKQSVNFAGERWVARQRSSPAISLQSGRIHVRIAYFDVINGVASEKATSVIKPEPITDRLSTLSFPLKKAIGF